MKLLFSRNQKNADRFRIASLELAGDYRNRADSMGISTRTVVHNVMYLNID